MSLLLILLEFIDHFSKENGYHVTPMDLISFNREFNILCYLKLIYLILLSEIFLHKIHFYQKQSFSLPTFTKYPFSTSLPSQHCLAPHQHLLGFNHLSAIFQPKPPQIKKDASCPSLTPQHCLTLFPPSQAMTSPHFSTSFA